MNMEELRQLLSAEIFPFLEELKDKLVAAEKLPLVVTNEDLKGLFQISDSTLNRLIKLADFPPCWYGIRGHYARDEVLRWFADKNYTNYIEEIRLLRSL